MSITPRRRLRHLVWALIGGLTLATACGAGGASGTITVYTSVTQDTVDAVVAGFETANPDATVEVFRAPTGELTARIAAELRDGDLQADLLWLTDPLSMQQYDADGLLLAWTPAGAGEIPAEYQTATFVGTRVLNMVIVAGRDLARPPADWSDLARLAAGGGVAIPDPAFAGSAFGALAYFALDDRYGMRFYEDLAAAGVIEVSSPGDVVTGVAEGQFAAGMTLDRIARDAIEDGSPIDLVWPASGAIAIYSPIGVVADSEKTEPARRFVEYVLGSEGQTAIAGTGWQPVRRDVAWEGSGPSVAVDWSTAFDRQRELLAEYEAILDG